MWLRTDAGMWGRADQFELLISFAATLAEDLFRVGRLLSVAIDADEPAPVRRVHDLEIWLDRLALVRPVEDAIGSAAPFPAVPPTGEGVSATQVARQNLVTFAPDGARGVAAYIDGQKMASA